MGLSDGIYPNDFGLTWQPLLKGSIIIKIREIPIQALETDSTVWFPVEHGRYVLVIADQSVHVPS